MSGAPSTSDLVIIAMIVFAPLALVLLVAFLRGYTIDLHMDREGGRRRLRRRRDDDDDTPGDPDR